MGGHQGRPGRVEGPSGRSRTCRDTLEKVQDGCRTLGEVQNGWRALGEVRDG